MAFNAQPLLVALLVAALALTSAVIGVADGPEPKQGGRREVYLCHMLPPKDGDSMRHLKIPMSKAVSQAHVDHPSDWRSVAGECVSDPLRETTADSPEQVGFLVCLDQPGTTMGRHVSANPDGQIDNRRAGCRLVSR